MQWSVTFSTYSTYMIQREHMMHAWLMTTSWKVAEVGKYIIFHFMYIIINVQNESIPAWVVEEILNLEILLLRKK